MIARRTLVNKPELPVNKKLRQMRLVKMLTNEYGEKHPSTKWHLVQSIGDSPRTVCGGEVFGIGESIATFKEKTNGKITCQDCINIVKWYKSIKL